MISETSSSSKFDVNVKSKKFYNGKNHFKWPASKFRTRFIAQKHNIVTQLPGVKRSANLGNSACAIDVWKSVFSDKMINDILVRTKYKLSTERTREP